MSFVFEASALMYLGKIQVLSKVAQLEGKKYIPETVYREVVIKGLERKEPEAKYIEQRIKEEHLLITKAKEIHLLSPLLSRADTEVICIAKEKKAIAIIDEIYARDIAESVGVTKHGSLWILLELLKKGMISKRETKQYLDKMIEEGFYLSITMYKEVFKKIDNM